jgi:hypothetical protein
MILTVAVLLLAMPSVARYVKLSGPTAGARLVDDEPLVLSLWELTEEADSPPASDVKTDPTSGTANSEETTRRATGHRRRVLKKAISMTANRNEPLIRAEASRPSSSEPSTERS